jgi:hypothetical protein
MKFLVILFLFISYFSFSQTDTLIRTEEQAIAIAERILFKTYGKKTIKHERPYHVKLKDGLWYISGTLKKGYIGGGFLIIINPKKGEILELTHGK